ncbi:hypothetical protein L195_g062542, partial [Trifolium pratense]
PTIADDLPSPLGQLSINLSDLQLTLTAYEISSPHVEHPPVSL